MCTNGHIVGLKKQYTSDMAKRFFQAVYLAGDWDGDRDAIDKIRQWNDGGRWSLSFRDIHRDIQARDTSLNCSIKRSLSKRMKQSDVFVLIVGDKTNRLTAGACYHCNKYLKVDDVARVCYAHTRMDVDNRSYIQYECEKAIQYGLQVIVLYNSQRVNKKKCPEILRTIGTHLPMKYVHPSYYDVGLFEGWNYYRVKEAINTAIQK